MRVLVVGDSCQDVFVYGNCKRLCPEAPVPVILPCETKINPGMAGNVKANIQALTSFCHFVTNCNCGQITKTRYVDAASNQMLLRVDENDQCERITVEGMKGIFEIDYDAIVLADYNKGFLEEDDIAHIALNHPLTFLDTKKKLGPWAENVTFIKINKKEFDATQDTLGAIKDIDKKLIVTLGGNGCRYDGKIHPTKEKLQTTDISGAGDTFMAGFVVKYLETKDVVQAILFAQECTDKIIRKKGVATV